jgi:TonB family protein
MLLLNSIPHMKTTLSTYTIALLLTSQLSIAQSVKPYPTYPGGEDAMTKFLQTNIRYPQSAIDKKVEGKIRVTFIVEYDGRVSQVLVWEGLSIPLNEEAARVVRSMPRWNMGYKDGKRVRGKYSIWLDFKMPDGMTASKKDVLSK